MSTESHHHPAQPPGHALTPGSEWQPPQELPHTPDTPAPLICAAGLTLVGLGLAWPSLLAGVLGAAVLIVGVVLWLTAGLSAWRAWLSDHPEEGS
ncbi:hypothetical protein [Deinococcus sonorensis]|uniref:Uncharacterized protein n=2 Tax=Deinococcus sonorensis TaxID=309891 RepID=A0AAU7U5D9_9DEIO